MDQDNKKPGWQAGQNETKGSRKDRAKHNQNQFQAIKKAFAGTPKTMLMVAIITGIERANICRYVAAMKRQNAISLVRFGLCRVTRHRAGYYTTSKIESL